MLNDDQELERFAIIDIGSNSVRLVIYESFEGAPFAVFNEKLLCGLGKDLEKSGQLYQSAKKKVHNALERFLYICRVHALDQCQLFATAAIRDAKDGVAFVKEIESLYHVSVAVLSGNDEAKLAANGVLASIYKPHGMVADLGGGSLELIPIDQGKIVDNGISLPLGSLRLADILDAKDGVNRIVSLISQCPFQTRLYNKTLYAVGGMFRSLAKIHMKRTDYALKVLHQFSCDTKPFLGTLHHIIGMTRKEHRQFEPLIGKKRSEQIGSVARMIEILLSIGRPRSIMFSVYGVRDGMAQSAIKVTSVNDPLERYCIARIGNQPITEYGYQLFHWMQSLFLDEVPAFKRLRLAACLLSEIARHDNAEYRARLAYARILDSTILAVTHNERIMIAKAVFYRYRVDFSPGVTHAREPILSPQAMRYCQKIGLAMRLAHHLSAGLKPIIDDSSLLLEEKQVVLLLKKKHQSLMGENIDKLLIKLAQCYRSKPVIRLH